MYPNPRSSTHDSFSVVEAIHDARGKINVWSLSTIFFRLLFECQQAVLKMKVSNWIPNHMSHTQPSTKRKTVAIKFTTAQIQKVER